jgi:hypothetical protein
MTVRNALKYTLLFWDLTEESNWTHFNNKVKYGIMVNLHRLGAFMGEFEVLKLAWQSDVFELLEVNTGSRYPDLDRLETDTAYFTQIQDLEAQFIAANPELQAYLNQTVTTYSIYTIDRAEIMMFDDQQFLTDEFPEVFVAALN